MTDREQLRAHLDRAWALEVGLMPGDMGLHRGTMNRAAYPTSLVQSMRDELAGAELRCVVSRSQRVVLDEVLALRAVPGKP